MNNPKIIVILGPTASGKSDIAVEIAREFNGEVISADSRQVYKGLDIGTGKITRKEMRGVKHYLIDVCSPTLRLRSGQAKRFTASDFKKLAEKAIAEIVDKNKVPIVCGGTGFYIDALLGDKQIPEVPPNLKLRKILEKKTTEELFEILQKLDPERAQNIDSKNPRRLVRAIEICNAIGRVPRYEARDTKYDVLKIGIKLDEKTLKTRINKRIDKWFRMGLLKEVQNLHQKGLSWKRMSEIGLEYKLVSQYLKSEIPNLKSLKLRMQQETWQYAKRQMTWFKKPTRLSHSGGDKNIFWLPPKISVILAKVRAHTGL